MQDDLAAHLARRARRLALDARNVEDADPETLRAFAREVLAVLGHRLGIALAGITAAFDPEVLVVGGGVLAAGDLLLDPARAALAEHLVGADHRELPPVRAASAGPEAGLVGAGLLAHRLLD